MLNFLTRAKANKRTILLEYSVSRQKVMVVLSIQSINCDRNY
ncbi:hypothetical protein AsAng_0045840 [Aureispira anguillae]|uniref:Uncharacterized protein n=1 Tax=Aureispira anguillae TaxID=2864201 RepID=A0A915YIW6_9BACT|nr:hypothetical protein AsAng_0045840 [Aureispira anguillae]